MNLMEVTLSLHPGSNLALLPRLTVFLWCLEFSRCLAPFEIGYNVEGRSSPSLPSCESDSGHTVADLFHSECFREDQDWEKRYEEMFISFYLGYIYLFGFEIKSCIPQRLFETLFTTLGHIVCRKGI